MHKKYIRNLVSLAVTFLVSCSNSSKPTLSKVEYQVFITTKAGSNVRLGNVPIMIMTEDGATELTGVYNKWARKCESDVYPGYKETLAKVAATYKRIVAEHGSLAYATPAFVADKLDTIRMVKEYESDRQFYLHDAVFKNKPRGYTDADGVFTDSLYSGTTYVVYALAQRQLSSEKSETYAWIQKFTVGHDDKIILSNNNLWDVEVQGKEMGFNPPPSLPRYPELY